MLEERRGQANKTLSDTTKGACTGMSFNTTSAKHAGTPGTPAGSHDASSQHYATPL